VAGVAPASLLATAVQVLAAADAHAASADRAGTRAATRHLTYPGTFDAGSVRGGTASPSPQIPPHVPNSATIRPTEAAGVPSVASNGLSSAHLPGFAGFNGLSGAGQLSGGPAPGAGSQGQARPGAGAGRHRSQLRRASAGRDGLPGHYARAGGAGVNARGTARRVAGSPCGRRRA
jgi:hypothetical protein